MTHVLHIANIDFEFELASNTSTGSLEKAWERNPLCLQLQYLPLLYAGPDDVVAVTAFPEDSFLKELEQLPWRRGELLPTLTLLSNKDLLEKLECQSWGYSKQVAEWAKVRKLKYRMPENWPMIRHVNSKAFSFESSNLKESSLLWNRSELEKWIHSFSGKKVLKTCFGLSGKGNRVIDESTSLSELVSFCEKEWNQQRPMIAEPWLDRIFDFSTQWFVGEDGHVDLIGSTVFETNAHGVYLGTIMGPEESIFLDHLPFLEEHKQTVRHVLKDMHELGFFGNVGVDALLYHSADNKIRLYPIVEINARKTMSWVGLQIQQKWFSQQTLRLSYSTHSEKNCFSLLPLNIPGRSFRHHLSVNQV